jgi:hypothetical protein
VAPGECVSFAAERIDDGPRRTVFWDWAEAIAEVGERDDRPPFALRPADWLAGPPPRADLEQAFFDAIPQAVDVTWSLFIGLAAPALVISLPAGGAAATGACSYGMADFVSLIVRTQARDARRRFAALLSRELKRSTLAQGLRAELKEEVDRVLRAAPGRRLDRDLVAHAMFRIPAALADLEALAGTRGASLTFAMASPRLRGRLLLEAGVERGQAEPQAWLYQSPCSTRTPEGVSLYDAPVRLALARRREGAPAVLRLTPYRLLRHAYSWRPTDKVAVDATCATVLGLDYLRKQLATL